MSHNKLGTVLLELSLILLCLPSLQKLISETDMISREEVRAVISWLSDNFIEGKGPHNDLPPLQLLSSLT